MNTTKSWSCCFSGVGIKQRLTHSCPPNSVSPRWQRKECLLSTAFINILDRERKERILNFATTPPMFHPRTNSSSSTHPNQARLSHASSKRSKHPTSQISDWAPVKPCHLVHRWDPLPEMHGLGNSEQGFPSFKHITSWKCNQHDSLNWESPTTILLAAYRLCQVW